MKKLFHILFLILFFACISCISCTKTIEVEKQMPVSIRVLTNAQNKVEIEKRRAALDLIKYTEYYMFFPSYSPKVGQVFYNHDGYAEALVIKVQNEADRVMQTFEGCRDSSKFFYRRLAQTRFGESMIYSCDSTGRINDSSFIYQYNKY